MDTTPQRRSRLRTAAILAAASVTLGLTVLLALRLITGHSLGLRSAAETQIVAAKHLVKRVADNRRVRGYSRGQFTNIIFLHHSVGNNLIEQGNLRQLFAERGYDFWDHGYNWPGMTDPNGQLAGYSYAVPDDNTDPDGLGRIFTQQVYDQPLNTLSSLLQHEVIIIKSCFLPANNMTTDQQMKDYRQWYVVIRDQMDKYPDKLFILLTTPPVNPAETNHEAATRAMAMASWLTSDEFLRGHPNIAVFDLYTQLAEMNPASLEYGMLRTDYRNGGDSHPNHLANEAVSPVLVDSVTQAIGAYRATHSQ